MIVIPEIFFDENIQESSFYELAIQVSEDKNTKISLKYAQYIWSLNEVEGPLDAEGNLVEFDVEKYYHDGIVQLGKHIIPFRLNVDKEEPGSYWFGICFYSDAITKVFGSKYKTYTEFPVVPNAITKFFVKLMKELNSIHPFLLALVGSEVSGQYYLRNFANDMSDNIISNCLFYVSSKNFKTICEENKKYFTVIDDLK